MTQNFTLIVNMYRQDFNKVAKILLNIVLFFMFSKRSTVHSKKKSAHLGNRILLNLDHCFVCILKPHQNNHSFMK